MHGKNIGPSSLPPNHWMSLPATWLTDNCKVFKHTSLVDFNQIVKEPPHMRKRSVPLHFPKISRMENLESRAETGKHMHESKAMAHGWVSR